MNSVILNRNKSIAIGKNSKLIKIQYIDKLTNKVIDEFRLYKAIRRKNKIFGYCLNAKIQFTFDTLLRAKKQIKIIKKNLK